MFKVFLAKVVAAKFASLIAALIAALAALVAAIGGASPGSGDLPTPTVAVTVSPSPTPIATPTVEPSPVVTPAPTPMPVVSTPTPKPVAKPSLSGLCNAVAHKGNLSARVGSHGRSIPLSVPASALGNGRYELTLKGITESGTTEDVGFYYFDVVKK